MITHLDHQYSYLRDNDVDACLARFERAGFIPIEKRTRHPGGHLNGFVRLTGTYLEFLSVIDEQEYQAESTSDDLLFRKEPGPFASGAVALDPDLIYRSLSPRYPAMDRPYSRGEAGKPDGPILWTFNVLPNEATPGAKVFALKYHFRTGEPYSPHIGANTIYGVTGLVLCSEDADRKCETWAATLSGITPNLKVNSRCISFGVQKLEWITPPEYQAKFGAKWLERESPNGDIAAVRLGAGSVETATAMMEAEGFKFLSKDNERAYSTKDFNTGYTFLIEKGDAESFCAGLNRHSSK